ncbi:MAG: DUF4143 domain-containing protein [Proteobacteria bacterium]|nr:DUF4143 domain-containing protein [Pseudomonadota bacterium]
MLKIPKTVVFRQEIQELATKHKKIAVFVDEVQKVPALLDEVHSLYEALRDQIRFVLSGSSARKLKSVGTNLLAGRALSLKLHPLTIPEYGMALDKRLRLGSLPGVVIDNEFPEQTLRSYVSTYLKEEIQQEALVRKVQSFARFLEVAAQFHTKSLNATTIAGYAGVSSQTVAEYVSILEDTLIAWRLPGWSASTTKQLRTAPKLYLFDNGVANALRGEIGVPMMESSRRYGELFEAFVIQEMFRWNDYNHLDLKFSYWRTNSGIEVDVIVSRGAGKPIAAIEIKSASHPEPKNFGGLKRFLEDYPGTALYCVSSAPRGYKEGDVSVIPYQEIYELLSTLN